MAYGIRALWALAALGIGCLGQFDRLARLDRFQRGQRHAQGYLGILTFNVIGATSTGSDITSSNEVLFDNEAVPIPSYWTGASVTVVDTLSGDANVSGWVDAQDVTKIKRIIVGLDPVTAGADANHDDAVNAGDLTKIKRIILGLD